MMKVRRTRAAAAMAGLLLVGALASAWLAYDRELRAARERVAAGSQVMATRCGPVEFAAAGRGPAVLLVHGAGGGFDQVLGIAHELAAHGYHAMSD